MHILRYLAIISITLVSISCAQLPKDFNAPQTTAIDSKTTADTLLGKKAAEHYSAGDMRSKIFATPEGTDAFVARMILAHTAERTLDVQYYIWHKDLIGQLLLGKLLEAADRGVRVRMLIDDISNQELDDYVYALDRHKNFEVRLFNPFASRKHRMADYISSPRRVNRRMHNKTFTADNQFAIVGGRNIGEEYFSAGLENNFKDIDGIIIGPIVQEVSTSFDTYWNSSVVFPVSAFKANQATDDDLNKVRIALAEFRAAQQNSDYSADLAESQLYQDFMAGNLQTKVYQGDYELVYDDPRKALGMSDKEITYLHSLLGPYFRNVKESLLILSPYFVPGKKGVAFLSDLVKKGIKVTVITNSLSSTDGVLAQSGYQKHRIKLLRAGVELYELKPNAVKKSLRRGKHSKSGLHAKVYNFDRKAIFIGSFNLDQRSSNINTEVGVIYKIPELASEAASMLDKGVENSAYKVELIKVPPNKNDSFPTEDYRVEWISNENGKEIRYSKDPETNGWDRFVVWFYGILPIESQL